MNIIRLGTKFINLDRVIDAEICLDENGDRGIALRYVVADATPPPISKISSTGATLLTTIVKGADAAALEDYSTNAASS